jgi:hypothetical protein
VVMLLHLCYYHPHYCHHLAIPTFIFALKTRSLGGAVMVGTALWLAEKVQGPVCLLYLVPCESKTGFDQR